MADPEITLEDVKLVLTSESLTVTVKHAGRVYRRVMTWPHPEIAFHLRNLHKLIHTERGDGDDHS